MDKEERLAVSFIDVMQPGAADIAIAGAERVEGTPIH
jgi:hypothetical protein